jgi:hypothetical protein
MYIVKSKISNYSLYGNQNVLRRGSPHFLPNTEVILSDFVRSQYHFHHKLRVRGVHKSGFLDTKGVHFRYLTELKLEEVINPTIKTLDFIKRNNILYIEDGKSWCSLKMIKDLILFFEEIQQPEIPSGTIEDELFLRSKNYVQYLQNSLVNSDFLKIIDFEFKFPIHIEHRRTFKILDKTEFMVSYYPIFCDEVAKSILETDLETIFPTEKRLIIGKIEIEIKAGHRFKISGITLW